MEGRLDEYPTLRRVVKHRRGNGETVVCDMIDAVRDLGITDVRFLVADAGYADNPKSLAKLLGRIALEAKGYITGKPVGQRVSDRVERLIFHFHGSLDGTELVQFLYDQGNAVSRFATVHRNEQRSHG